MKKDPLDEVTSEYKERGKKSNSAFSDKMRQQLNDIEDQETFNQIVKEAKKEERIRKELEENARFRDEMRKKYQDQASGKDIEKSQENIFPKVNDSVPKVEKASKPTFIVENGNGVAGHSLLLTKKSILSKLLFMEIRPLLVEVLSGCAC